MLRVIVVDDEPPARRGLRRLLQGNEDVEVVGEASTLDEAGELTRALTPDAIFLDVELGSEKGFDLIGRLDPVPAIIFVTAHSSYAPRAFDVAALDFLQKPASRQRVALTLERLRHRQLILADADARRSNGVAAPPVAKQAEQRIHVRTAGQLAVIPTDMIVMLSAEADFTRIITTDGHDYLVCRLLGQFEAELPTPPFFRVSRSLVVNLDRVERVRSDGGGRSLVAFGRSVKPVALGRAATKRLRHILAESAWTAFHRREEL
ncbi:LytTR family DNA-binding domain-containing protein [Mesorhizobium sp. YM1C-6-2]|uniref:LytR/AlgR family response regulator transcription factor n=1 Tax=Mesorhizobium sp. YM1C-6-2 TaxID=1827501 RepID=UPI000EF26301|nr:LytTR family DNA-binding domain-containing protein [Mesorhizobium sp. YM1C-6-2]RLP28066.1 DNA-binding response regulator [Mesorhizobium sp. YM1C-6-2]